MALKNTLSEVSKWKPLLVINISHLLWKIDARLIFFLKPSFKKVPFLNMGVIKHQQKLVYRLHEYFKQRNNDKRQELACLWGGITFPITIIHSTMSILQADYLNQEFVFVMEHIHMCKNLYLQS